MPRDPAVNPDDDRVRHSKWFFASQHMLKWARKAVRFCNGRTPSDFDHDELLLPAVLRAIDTIGKASTKVSEPTRARLPGIDWWAVRRMRGRIIHGYDTVDATVVWNTVQLAVPELIAELERALAE